MDQSTTSRPRSLKALLALTLLTGSFLASSGIAQARPPEYYARGYHEHEVYARRAYVVHRPPPRVVYAPPVVVAPPPEPEPGINLVFPLHIN